MGYALRMYRERAKGISSALTVFGCTLLLCLAQQIAIPFLFTPVPVVIVLQVVIFLSVLFGKKGFYATCAYLGVGMVGVPVFSSPAVFFGPSGGYLIGYAVLSFCIATIIEKMKERTESKVFGLMLLANGIVYLFGVPQLALYVGMKSAITLGVLPFVAADLFKLCLTQIALRKVRFFG